MDEEKSCRDEDCCEDRPQNESDLGQGIHIGTGLRYAADYRGDRPTANQGIHAQPMEDCDEPIRDGGNRIQDLVIKQMDLGYLVKARCQPL